MALRLGCMSAMASALLMRPQLNAGPKVCAGCGEKNGFNALRCGGCGGDRFAPYWVRASRKIDRGFWVQVNEGYGTNGGTRPILTLRKSWRGGISSVQIYDQVQWERVKRVIESEFAEDLDWTSADAMSAAVPSGESPEEAREPTSQNGRLLLEVLGSLPVEALSEGPVKDLVAPLERLSELGAKLGEAQRSRTREATDGVSQDKSSAARQLGDLFEACRASDRAVMKAELRRRAGVLELVKERLHDERSYRIVNYRCLIHRFLEQAMWIFDDRFWLLGDDQGLRIALDRAAVAQDRPYARKAPDFACGVVDGHLLVVCARPPSRKLEVEDLDLVERQVAACRSIKKFESFEAILVGAGVSSELQAISELRDDAFQVKSYGELLDRPLGRYSARLEALGAGA